MLAQVEALYNQMKGSKETLEESVKKAETRVQEIELTKMDNEKILILLQQAADAGRQQAKTFIEDLVTKSLQYILSSNYTFEIEISNKSKPSAEFYIIKPDGKYTIDESGGGVADIVSTALRFAFIELLGTVKGPVILDEPGKMVSEEASNKFASFIKTLATNLNRQVIIVTHNDNIKNIVDKTFKVELKNGKSKATEEQIAGGTL